jgi:mycothiol system anti-sigma-R factor
MSDDDCRQLVIRIWQYLDGEADEQLCTDLQAHLAKCPPCQQHAEFEVKLRQVIQLKCRGERAPEHLRASLARIVGWTLAIALTFLVGATILNVWAI